MRVTKKLNADFTTKDRLWPPDFGRHELPDAKIKRNGWDEPETPEPRFCSGFGQYHSDKNGQPYADISLTEIQNLVDNPAQCEKQKSQWIIPSTLKSRRFSDQEQSGQYWLLWLDFDDNPPALNEIKRHLIKIIGNADFEIYNTSSATLPNQKSRGLIPMDQWLGFEDWTRCQRILNDKFEALGIKPDRANERAAQLCYLPNRGQLYNSEHQRNGIFFNPLEKFADEILAIDTREKAEKKRIDARAKAAEKKRASLKYDGSEGGLINAFNESYTVAEILLRNGYKQHALKFCHPHS